VENDQQDHGSLMDQNLWSTHDLIAY